MRSFAKKADTTVKKVERLWNKSEKLVKKKYDLTPQEDSDRFYALVVSVLKKILGIDTKKEIKEDTITTGNMGAYQFYDKVGGIAKRKIPVTDKDYEELNTQSDDDIDSKKLAKRIAKIVAIVNEDMEIFDDYLDYFKQRYDSPDIIIEKTVDFVEKKLGIVKSVMDK